jgi:KipI family sensor histidine kinase inhibitor
VRFRPCGDAAVLLELDDLAEVMATAPALLQARSETSMIIDVVPAARTILVRFDPAQTTIAGVAAWIERQPTPADRTVLDRSEPRIIEVPVTYDGADLDEVGRLTGLGPDGVVAAHTARPWTVAFLGFAPGFAYCTGGDPRLRVPRRADPRQRVPIGAVGLADDLTAVYPRASPGGWQLIGRTDVAVWDPERDPPALLAPGTTVQFQAVRT